MNRIEAADIKYLVSNPHPLQPLKSSAPEHPLGTGVTNPKTFGSAKIPVPKAGVGAQRLREAATAQRMGVPASYAAQTWAALLSSPTLAAELPVADLATLSAEGIEVDSASFDRMRRIVLASVFEIAPPAGEAHVAERFALIAVITVRLHPTQNVAEDGWASFQQAASTDQLISILSDMPDLNKKASGKPSKVTVLVGSDVAEEFRLREGRIREAAAMCGVLLSQHLVTPATARATAKSVRAASTRWLITVGSTHDMEPIRDAFRAAEPNGRLYEVSALDGFVTPLRERLAQAATIGPGLHSWVEPPTQNRPPLPVGVAEKCLHQRRKKWTFVLDGSTQLWWTRDDVGHGGNQFKTFRKLNNALVHENERDEAGAAIPKHKGPTGYRIETKDLEGCGEDPAVHIR